MPTKKVTMADTLRAAIRAKGATVAEVSRRTGIAQPVLHRFVTGERDLTLRTADRLLSYLGLILSCPCRRGGSRKRDSRCSKT